MIGVCNDGAHDLLKKFESHYFSMVVEAYVKLRVRGVAYQDLCCNTWCMSCFNVLRKADLIYDILNDLSLWYISSSICKSVYIDYKVVLYVSLVFNV